MKMDCEGCEYEIFRNISSENIRMFKRMVIEYHCGSSELIHIIKKAGFKVLIRSIYGNPLDIGLLYAERVDVYAET